MKATLYCTEQLFVKPLLAVWWNVEKNGKENGREWWMPGRRKERNTAKVNAWQI